MKHIFTSIFLFLSLGVYAQPFPIGNTTVTFNDPSRSNRAIETDIYYPAVSAGSNTALAGAAGERFPVVVFGHGFVMTVGSYQNIWEALAPRGYIVALPKTEGSFSPNHTNFGIDLAFLVGAIQNAGTSPGNLFFEKVASTSCVMGHSMGGGAATLAVQYNSNITALAGLAPAETNPTASGAAQNITIPSLIFAGGNDCVTPAGQHSLLIYNSLASSCKSYVTITGGSHCQFANSNFNCSFGELTCSPGPTISRTVQQGKVNQYLIPWLDFRLKGDCQGWFYLQNTLFTDPTVSVQQDCSSPFVCPTPLGRKTNFIRAKSAVLKWKLPTCYTGFQVRYRLSGTNVWTVVNVGTANTYYLIGLTPGTTYEWGVRNICDIAQTSFSPWGPKQTFTTLLVNPVARMGEDADSEWSSMLFPNPSNGLFEIRFTGGTGSAVNVEVYNSIGKLILKQEKLIISDTQSESFDLTGSPAGLYFIKISDDISVNTQRVVIR